MVNARQITKKMRKKLSAVAQMRVEGASWGIVATKYGYKTAESARVAITDIHPELWRELYEDTRAKYLDQMEAEAVLTQRELLRLDQIEKGKDVPPSDVHRIRQSAAHSLMNHAARLRAQKIELKGNFGVAVNMNGQSKVEEYAAWIAEHRLNGKAKESETTDENEGASDDGGESAAEN